MKKCLMSLKGGWNRGLLDLDYDPLTGKKKKTDAEKVREALTPSKKRRIREAVGNKCEIPQCKSDAYDVHHIKPVKEGGTNVDNNLNVASNRHCLIF
ncbi:MAG: HNH endonuclease [Methanophagales archaeon]|nr:HNH endonuclease [Methanophagales archaeon]